MLATAMTTALTLYDELSLLDLETELDQCREGAAMVGRTQACSNVEVAVGHKRPLCATIIVISFLVSVVVAIFMCSAQMEQGRRFLRGDAYAWLD